MQCLGNCTQPPDFIAQDTPAAELRARLDACLPYRQTADADSESLKKPPIPLPELGMDEQSESAQIDSELALANTLLPEIFRSLCYRARLDLKGGAPHRLLRRIYRNRFRVRGR